MTQPDPTNGDLKHMEWDAWGFVPSGFTVTYLVFRPLRFVGDCRQGEKSGTVYWDSVCGPTRIPS